MPATIAPRPLLRRPRVLALAVVVGLATGLVLDVLARGSAAPGPPPYEALGRAVTVDGRAVYLDCRGPATDGRPTVILEGGLGSGASGWGTTFDDVATFARVCAWDRPGIGGSAARGRHSAAETMDDLVAALDGAGERGPFVVAAHSLGGVYARILGARPEAAALLMIDAFYPDVGLERDPALPASFREAFGNSMAETGSMIQSGEDLDWTRTMAELRAAGPFEGPATMLTVDQRLRFTDPDPAIQAAIIEAWATAVRAMFPNGTLETVPDVGHWIHLDRPALVVERIRELWQVAQRSP